MLRQRGNVYFELGLQDSLSPAACECKLQKAASLYEEALAKCEGSFCEKASCQKNLAMVFAKLSEILLQRSLRSGQFLEQDEDLFTSHLTRSFSAGVEAFKLGDRAKPTKWICSLLKRLADHLNESRCSIMRLESGKQVDQCLRTLCGLTESMLPLSRSSRDVAAAAAQANLQLASLTFHKCAPLLMVRQALDLHTFCGDAMSDILSLMRHLEDSRTLLARARQFVSKAGEQSLSRKIDDLSHQVHLYLDICQSRWARAEGMHLLKRGVRGGRVVNMDAVRLAIDKLKESAAAIPEEQDTCHESKGLALADVARVYAKVLRQDDVAHEFYYLALQICQNVTHKELRAGMMREAWYQECADALRAHSARKKAEDAEEARALALEERARALEELRGVLYELRGKAGGCAERFLEHVYKQHPPKNAGHRMGEIGRGRTRHALLEAIRHYHPDKNSVCAYGAKWHALCEEITKGLTEKYGYFKRE
eukprot:jgi/Mesen1/4043/ME000213S03074